MVETPERRPRRLDDAAAPDFIARCLDWDDGGRREETGIPQGSVLAPWLCNVYLWRLDDHMRDHGTGMVRFADDFVALADTRKMAEQAMAECAAIVNALRLRLHPFKTAIVGAGAPL